MAQNVEKDSKVGQRPVGRSRKHPLELSETQVDKEKVQTHLTQESANERAPIVLFNYSFA